MGQSATRRKWLLSELSKGLDSGADSAPVHWFTVLAFLQQVLQALVVWVLVEGPPTSQDPAGVNLPPVVPLQHRGAVLSGFKHLAAKVPFTIELDHVRISAGLREDDAEDSLVGAPSLVSDTTG